jgi:putative transcriptional regulator
MAKNVKEIESLARNWTDNILPAPEMLAGTPRRPGLPRVETPAADSLDVRAIRLKATGAIGATQETFAQAIGVPVRTLRNWEQRRRKPTGPARVLLALIALDPWIVFDAMNRPATR